MHLHISLFFLADVFDQIARDLRNIVPPTAVVAGELQIFHPSAQKVRQFKKKYSWDLIIVPISKKFFTIYSELDVHLDCRGLPHFKVVKSCD